MGSIKLLVLALASCFLLAAPKVFADANDQLFGACSGKASSSSICQGKDQGSNGQNPATHIINVAANIVAIMTAIGAIIMIILGGITYMTAGGATPGQRAGDANKVAGAKRQITYAVVGLIVVFLAWAITRFVTDRVLQ